MKPFQNGTEDGMFGHPTRNAFALLHSIGWLSNDKTYRRVITRNGPILQVFEDMRVAVKISRPSHR